jgi:tRNA modification GTPase
MDLLKAEGINDLINATSKRAKLLDSKTLSGENTRFATNLKNTLLDYMSRLEYFVENQYDDEQLDDYSGELETIGSALLTNIMELSQIIEKTKKANRQYQGFNIAIAGEPNVGKSTLLNALLKEDKAIVSPIPGTTRDVVEGEKEIDGLLFRFKDTAGIRKTDDYVESLGIERSYKTIVDADLVLLVSDCGFKDMDNNQDLKDAIQNKPTIKVATKRDLNPNHEEGDLSICSMSDDLTPLIRLILSKLNLTEKEESLFLGKREEEYLIKIQEQMKLSYDALSDTRNIDIVSDTLRVAIAYINDLMGNSESQTMEDIYQTLFSKFCLGK